MSKTRYICDRKRHLVCFPYSIQNLHRMAEELGIKRCWFHRNHYDIPKRMNDELLASGKVQVVHTRTIVEIIQSSVSDQINDKKLLTLYSTHI